MQSAELKIGALMAAYSCACRANEIAADARATGYTSASGRTIQLRLRMLEQEADLLARVRAGEPRARGELFALHRAHLERMIELRLDARLRGRVEASDVVQDAIAEAIERFERYLAEEQPMPFRLWLRFLAKQRLALVHRQNFGVQGRDVRREVGLGMQDATTSCANLAEAFVATQTSPTLAARRGEVRERVEAAIGALSDQDREIVALRQFEGLSNEEAASELGIETSAASKRFLRALARLRSALDGLET